MKFVNTLLAFASSFSSLAAASPLHANHTNLPLSAKTIFQFNQTGTWIENVAVRPNGDLLMTMLGPSASVWTLKQPYSATPEASLVHTFADGATGLNGIAETSPDVFVVLGAHYTGVGAPDQGSFKAWELAFTGPSRSAAVRKIADLTDAQLANGVAAVSSCGRGHDIVLISDSFAGALWRLDTQTGEYETVMRVPEMAAPAGGASPIGINGLKVHNGFAYWSNSAKVAIYRTRIDEHGYPAPNVTVETVAQLDSPFVDDFAFDARGLLWAATNGDNKVDVVRLDGSFETVVGGAAEDTVGGDSAVAMGRTLLDRHVVYVTTSGTLPNNHTEPAKVVAVDRAGFY
ncbi:hypothetical protein F4677DRAFT_437725 [Hypoxylon crocopeplum]|nr:hypothetical protein F4677DRAFT_437725 [Hypoxylon crocopeplum]